ncbi:hypothetical protein ABG067_005188 [Albugo candida]
MAHCPGPGNLCHFEKVTCLTLLTAVVYDGHSWVLHILTFLRGLLDCIQKVRNQQIHYKAVQFYLEQHPLELTRLLQVLTPNLDHARVVHQLRKSKNLPLVVEYLKDVQKENLSALNEALNKVLVDEEDYQGIRDSINVYDNFDHIA